MSKLEYIIGKSQNFNRKNNTFFTEFIYTKIS